MHDSSRVHDILVCYLFWFFFLRVYRRLFQVIERYVKAVFFSERHHTQKWAPCIRPLFSVISKRPTISSITAIRLQWSQQGIFGPQPHWSFSDCLEHHNKGNKVLHTPLAETMPVMYTTRVFYRNWVCVEAFSYEADKQRLFMSES